MIKLGSFAHTPIQCLAKRMRLENEPTKACKWIIFVEVFVLLVAAVNGRMIVLATSGQITWDGTCDISALEETCTNAAPCYLPNTTLFLKSMENAPCELFLMPGDYGSSCYEMTTGLNPPSELIITSTQDDTTRINLKLGEGASPHFLVTLKQAVFCCSSLLQLDVPGTVNMVNITMLSGSRIQAKYFQKLTISTSQIVSSKPCITIMSVNTTYASIEISESVLSSSLAMIHAQHTSVVHLAINRSSFSGPTLISGEMAMPVATIDFSLIVGLQNSMFSDPCRITYLSVSESTLQGSSEDNSANFCATQLYPLEALRVKRTITSLFSMGPFEANTMSIEGSNFNDPQGTLKISGTPASIVGNQFAHTTSSPSCLHLHGNLESSQRLLLTGNSWARSPDNLDTVSNLGIADFAGIVDFGSQQQVSVLTIDHLNLTGHLTITNEIRGPAYTCGTVTAADDGSHVTLHSVLASHICFTLDKGMFSYVPTDPPRGIRSTDSQALPTTWVLSSVIPTIEGAGNLLESGVDYPIASNVSSFWSSHTQFSIDGIFLLEADEGEISFELMTAPVSTEPIPTSFISSSAALLHFGVAIVSIALLPALLG